MTRCPLCDEEARPFDRILGKGLFLRCSACSFIFFEGDYVPDPTIDFSKAYLGELREPHMMDISERIRLWMTLERAHVPLEQRLTAQHKIGLAFIRGNFPKGVLVLDIGCGTGEFLDALKRSGYTPYGVDAARPVVEWLKARGERVWWGTVDTMPEVKPACCTLFNVLHHVADPVSFLRVIRARFPRAPLIVGEFDNIEEAVSGGCYQIGPPRYFTLWNAQTLHLALEHAGYEAIVLPVLGREVGVPRLASFWFHKLRRVLSLTLPQVYSVVFQLMLFRERLMSFVKPPCRQIVAIGY